MQQYDKLTNLIRYGFLYGILSFVTACGSSGGGAGSTEQPVDELTEANDGCTVGARLVGNTMTAADFNGDGCEDLAIGVPGEDSGVGRVSIVYGTDEGLNAAGTQSWMAGGGGLGSTPGQFLQGDLTGSGLFGTSLAWGDFNADGYSDLAVGVPNQNNGVTGQSGAVQVIYGSVDGLSGLDNQFIDQTGVYNDPEGDGKGVYQGDIYGGPEQGDNFGGSLASGDFNGDGFHDLAIGAYKEDIGAVPDSGSVNVLYGSSTGLGWQNNEFLSSDEFRREDNGANTYTFLGDLLGIAEDSDYFGSRLASGDINNDGYDELVIAAVGEAIGVQTGAGAVHIIPGSADGLTPVNHQHLHRDALYTDTDGDGTDDVTVGDPAASATMGDRFGAGLVVGDFNNDTFDDVAVGVSFSDNQGAVQVFYGSANYLDLAREALIDSENIVIYQDSTASGNEAINGSSREELSRFGSELTTGDFNGDSVMDLAISSPMATVAGYDEAGTVTVLHGSESGLTSNGHIWISLSGVKDEAGSPIGSLVATLTINNVRLGYSLTAADFDDDGFADLAMGIPIYPPAGAGAVEVMTGSENGLTVSGNQLWSQEGGVDDSGTDLGDLDDSSEFADYFGLSMPGSVWQ